MFLNSRLNYDKLILSLKILFLKIGILVKNKKNRFIF